ncbi:MAG: tRNA lysidine(34) synthetase TilS, partial [Anaerolineae bacterium]
TNADVSFARNRVRHEVLPLLETMNGRVREALLRLAGTTAMDLEVLDAETDRAWAAAVEERGEGFRVGRGPWEAMVPALRRRLVRRILARLGADLRRVGPAHLDAVAALTVSWRPGAEVPLPGGLRAVLGYSAIVFAPSSDGIPTPPGLSAEAVPLTVPGRLDLPSGWRIEAMSRPRTPADPPGDPERWRAVMDAAAVAGGLAVRRRRPGDRMSPIGMAGGHKSLQDLFTDERVPRNRRDGWPVVVAGDGVVWVPGLRLDDGVKVVPGTKSVVELVARPPEWSTPY